MDFRQHYHQTIFLSSLQHFIYFSWKRIVGISDYMYKQNVILYSVKPVLRGHLWDEEKVVFKDRWPLHMKCSMTRQEKGDPLI